MSACDHKSDACKCLPQCIWCGSSLNESEAKVRAGRGRHANRYECVDGVACDARIKRRILLGPGR